MRKLVMLCYGVLKNRAPFDRAWLGRGSGHYRSKNNTVVTTAAASRAMSKSRGVRIGLPRCGIHGFFGVEKITTGRIFIVFPPTRYFAHGLRGLPDSEAFFPRR
jgi:hypothetical protein